MDNLGGKMGKQSASRSLVLSEVPGDDDGPSALRDMAAALEISRQVFELTERMRRATVADARKEEGSLDHFFS
jgi:hypothetical protein